MAGSQSTSAGAAGRYASALFELAHEAGAIDAVAGDLASVRAMLDDSEDLRRLTDSPTFSREQKSASLAAIAQRAGLGDLATRFMGVMAANGRAGDLKSAITAFEKLVAEHRGVLVADVAAAHALSDTQQKSLRDALKSAFGRDVDMRTSQKPDLLGGLVVTVGSRMFDSSLKTKLEGLKQAMKGT